MKNIHLIFTILLTSLVQGQAFDLPSDYIRNNTQGNNIKLEKVEGSPYRYDEFKEGKLEINDMVYNARMRYNIYKDEIELKGESNNITNVLKREHIKVTIGTENLGVHKFVFGNTVKQGYFVELSKNGDFTEVILLKRLIRTYTAATKATSTYKKDIPPRIINEEEYYLRFSEKPARSVKLNKRSMFSAVGKEDDKAKAYFRNNKLKNESDAIDFINFYNSN